MNAESPSQHLAAIAGVVSEGLEIDWNDVETRTASEAEREAMRALRDIARVGDAHRRLGRREPATATPPQAPTRWGRLEVLERIGHGGFAEVYRATDPDLQRDVALKLYHPDRLRKSGKEALLAEARGLARVRHTNVVTIHGADERDGRVGIWMDLIVGKTLREEVQARRTLGAEEAAAIGIKLCQALAAVHRASLVHGDIKAHNVMREAGGRIVLMDFSAVRRSDVPDDAAADSLSGTPLYMAPELFERASPGVTSDIYSLGVLLFNLVTARFPVEAESMSGLVLSHATGEHTLLRDVRPDLPESFVRVVEKALATVPDARYHSAGELERALDEVQSPTGSRAADPATRSTDLHPALRIAGLLASGVLGLSALGFITVTAAEVFMQIPGRFVTHTLLDYANWGARAMVPIVFNWIVALLALGAVIALQKLAAGAWRVMVTGRAGLHHDGFSWSRVVNDRLAAWDPSFVASAIFVVGALCWLGVTWAFADIFVAAVGIRDAPAQRLVGLAVLGPQSQPLHKAQTSTYAIVMFLLAFALWQQFPSLEQRSAGTGTVRLMRWGCMVTIALSLIVAVLPYRLLWHSRYERIEFDGARSYVLGRTPTEQLLYTPMADRPHRIVAPDDPRIDRRADGLVENVFIEE